MLSPMRKIINRFIGSLVSCVPAKFVLFFIKYQERAIYYIGKKYNNAKGDKSRLTKETLISLLKLESAVDIAVNMIVNSYYTGRHPKHFLWTSHNDFIVDNIEKKEKVLDVGCGLSQYPLRLAEKGAMILCVDNSKEKIDKISQINVHPNISYKVMDITKSIPNDTFNTVICSHVLEHIDDSVAFLARLREVAPRLIIKVPRTDSSWKKVMKKDLGIFWYDDKDHKREYTWDIILKELELGGWTPVKKETGLDLRIVAERKNRD